MSKSHRDNTEARKKRGQEAFDKRAARREVVPRCQGCGKAARAQKLTGGYCPVCLGKV